LALILVELLAEAEKIGATTPRLSTPPEQNKPKLFDQVSDIIRRKTCSIRVDRSGTGWDRH
jgi:hypothetical protein